MSTQTKNYGFTKDNENDFYNVNTVNNNLDKIDTEMKRIEEEAKSFNQQVADNTKATAAVDTKVDKHIKDDSGHVRFIGNASGGTGMACRTDLAPVDLVNGKLVPRKGHAFRFLKVDVANTGPHTFTIVSDTLPGNPGSATYPILNGSGQQLNGGEMVKDGIYTLVFNGSAFILQGESGVKPGRSVMNYIVPGTYDFVVPRGVSKLTCYIWGAGGGGGGCSDQNGYFGGGGGGGGGFVLAALDVNPGEVLKITVGKGGNGGIGYQGGLAGGFSTIVSPTMTVTAGGGGGTTWGGPSSPGAQYPTPGAGGGGGTYATQGITNKIGVNETGENGKLYAFNNYYPGKLLHAFGGGDGAYASTPNYGGGGGGGASDMSGGLRGYQNSGGGEGKEVSNWKGGNGVGSNYKSQGINGNRPGGGGSGSTLVSGAGGNGADGQVIIYW